MTTTIYEDDRGMQVISASNGQGRGCRLEFTEGRLDDPDEADYLAHGLRLWADEERARRRHDKHECYWRGCTKDTEYRTVAPIREGTSCWACSEHAVMLGTWWREGT